MAKFKDGAGKEHPFKFRMRPLRVIKEKLGFDIEKVFKAAYLPAKGADADPMPLMDLLYGDMERLAAIIVEICDLSGDTAKQVLDDMDEDSFDNGRDLLMEMLGSFCLPPALREKVLAAFRESKTKNLNLLPGLNSETDSPVS